MRNDPGDVDFSKRREIEYNVVGPTVLLRRKFFNTELEDEMEWLAASLAVLLLMSDPLNGVMYKSGMIEWVYNYAGDWDGSA